MNATADMRAQAAATVQGWTELNRLWLVATVARLRQRLESPRPAGDGVPTADCIDIENVSGFTPALVHCATIFGLSPFERELLLLVAGLELDQGLRDAVARLNSGGPAKANYGLAFAMLTEPHWDALSPNAALRRWRMVMPEPGGDLTRAALRIDERMLHYITGVAATDPALDGVAGLVVPADVDDTEPPLARRIARVLAQEARRGPIAVVRGHAHDPVARRDVVLAAVAQLGRMALWIEARDLPADADALLLLATHVDREALLNGVIPVLSVDSAGETAALGLAARLRSAFIWLGADHPALAALPQGGRVLRFDVPATREAVRGGFESIAQRIETRASLDDVVLPSGQSAMLRDIASHLRQRERVYRDWGFGDRHRSGQGLLALFAGESGTGKTLAAEAIARDVDLDLYRVDLASVISKYIGETEKNLKRLFDAAEQSDAVLLFDEADALFGKRSEVKDSHDRYANIEVAYLLQRVEAYRGLAVLTTNMKSTLDRAFTRRIRFVVSFPFPDTAAREQIWRRQFPSGAPLGDIDFAALARLNIAGGSIRSVAINAAFKAAEAGSCIDQSLLMAAARAEFLKLERNMNDVGSGSMR